MKSHCSCRPHEFSTTLTTNVFCFLVVHLCVLYCIVSIKKKLLGFGVLMFVIGLVRIISNVWIRETNLKQKINSICRCLCITLEILYFTTFPIPLEMGISLANGKVMDFWKCQVENVLCKLFKLLCLVDQWGRCNSDVCPIGVAVWPHFSVNVCSVNHLRFGSLSCRVKFGSNALTRNKYPL